MSEVNTVSLPRYYKDVCEDLPEEYSDYKNYVPKFGPQENYELIKKVNY